MGSLTKTATFFHQIKNRIYLANTWSIINGSIFQTNVHKYRPTTTERHISSTCARSLPLPNNIEETVNVRQFDAFVSNQPINIEEGTDANGREMVGFNYTTFRTMAEVRVPPVPEGEKWQIGYIQAIERHKIEDQYSDAGSTKVVIPELESGDFPMICDTIDCNYPWYLTSMTLETLEGSNEEQTVQISLVDVPSSITYTNTRDFLRTFESKTQTLCRIFKLRSLFGQKSDILPAKVDEEPLTLITREIIFNLWLVIRCAKTGAYHILKSAVWEVDLLIGYDVTKPLGQRANSLKGPGRGVQRPPVIMDRDHADIPVCVFGPPSANDAFFEMWSPKNMELPQKLLKPPAWKPDFKIP